MKRIRGAAFLLLCALIAQLFSGCDGSSRIIRMDIGGPVLNLDPQFCQDPTARMILMNLCEGLLVRGEDGLPRLGAAKEYQVSEDGLSYTFILRENACWEDDTPLRAEDFVFAFRRIFSPDAPSPFADEFLMIDGAQEILNGNVPLSALGVRASGDDSVVFTLVRPSEIFLDLLADTPALPCNEEVFKASRGRYGLEPEYVFSNGPFRLAKWDNTRFLYLDRSESYRAEKAALPERVTFYIGRGDPVRQFIEGKSDLVPLPADSRLEQWEDKARLLPASQTVWCIVFNQEDAVWGNPLLRQGLAHAVDRNAFENELADNLTVARVLLPLTIKAGGGIYRELAGDSIGLGFDIAQGKRLYELGLRALNLDELPRVSLLIPEGGGHRLYMSRIQRDWQTYLDADINITSVSPERLAERLRNGDYQLALIPLTPPTPSPDALLGIFRAGSGQNYTGYRSARFDSFLDSARVVSGEDEGIRYYKAAEDMLLTDAAVIPVYFATVRYASHKSLMGIEISPFGGQILFRGAIKISR